MTPNHLSIGGDNVGILVVQSGRMCNRHGLVAGATGTGKNRYPANPGRGVFPHGFAGICRGCKRRSVGYCRSGCGPSQKSMKG